MQGEHATYTNRNLVKGRPTEVISCINSCSQTVRLTGDPLASSYSCSIELAEKFECIIIIVPRSSQVTKDIMLTYQDIHLLSLTVPVHSFPELFLTLNINRMHTS